MATITSKHIHAAYSLAGDVYEGKVAPGIAAARLNAETGLNVGSARDFFVQYRSMLEGAVFKRTLSAEAAEYFLANLLSSRGRLAAESSVAALWKHIAYYESLGHGRLNKLRKVVAAFASSLPGPPSSDAEAAEFEAAVVASQNDSDALRAKRLLSANPVPTIQVVTARVFQRNPDVVATVLARAKGICEACASAAPFTRRRDGTPYLEVHHRVLLAEGGQDTVANAIAVCPNCHRKAHHG
jgi:5-methylcytosine-specific restriction protein A